MTLRINPENYDAEPQLPWAEQLPSHLEEFRMLTALQSCKDPFQHLRLPPWDLPGLWTSQLPMSDGDTGTDGTVEPTGTGTLAALA